MVKIFKEKDQITVIFPKNEKAEEQIERILKEVYGEAENTQEIEVQGLLAAKVPPKENGVQVISQTPKKTYKRENNILKDKRNPYKDKLPFDVFVEHGIKAMLAYRDMGLGKSEYDIQINRELFTDFKKYLLKINTPEYMTETDLEEIKQIIKVISTCIYADPIKSILKSVAMESVDTFIAEASESQIRSAAVKVVGDTLKRIR